MFTIGGNNSLGTSGNNAWHFNRAKLWETGIECSVTTAPPARIVPSNSRIPMNSGYCSPNTSTYIPNLSNVELPGCSFNNASGNATALDYSTSTLSSRAPVYSGSSPYQHLYPSRKKPYWSQFDNCGINYDTNASYEHILPTSAVTTSNFSVTNYPRALTQADQIEYRRTPENSTWSIQNQRYVNYSNCTYNNNTVLRGNRLAASSISNCERGSLPISLRDSTSPKYLYQGTLYGQQEQVQLSNDSVPTTICQAKIASTECQVVLHGPKDNTKSDKNAPVSISETESPTTECHTSSTGQQEQPQANNANDNASAPSSVPELTAEPGTVLHEAVNFVAQGAQAQVDAGQSEDNTIPKRNQSKNVLLVSLPGGAPLFSVPLLSSSTPIKRRGRPRKSNPKTPPEVLKNRTVRYKRGQCHLQLHQAAPNLNPIVYTLDAMRSFRSTTLSNGKNIEVASHSVSKIFEDSEVQIIGCFPRTTSTDKRSQPQQNNNHYYDIAPSTNLGSSVISEAPAEHATNHDVIYAHSSKEITVEREVMKEAMPVAEEQNDYLTLTPSSHNSPDFNNFKDNVKNTESVSNVDNTPNDKRKHNANATGRKVSLFNQVSNSNADFLKCQDFAHPTKRLRNNRKSKNRVTLKNRKDANHVSNLHKDANKTHTESTSLPTLCLDMPNIFDILDKPIAPTLKDGDYIENLGNLNKTGKTPEKAPTQQTQLSFQTKSAEDSSNISINDFFPSFLSEDSDTESEPEIDLGVETSENDHVAGNCTFENSRDVAISNNTEPNLNKNLTTMKQSITTRDKRLIADKTVENSEFLFSANSKASLHHCGKDVSENTNKDLDLNPYAVLESNTKDSEEVEVRLHSTISHCPNIVVPKPIRRFTTNNNLSRKNNSNVAPVSPFLSVWELDNLVESNDEALSNTKVDRSEPDTGKGTTNLCTSTNSPCLPHQPLTTVISDACASAFVRVNPAASNKIKSVGAPSPKRKSTKSQPEHLKRSKISKTIIPRHNLNSIELQHSSVKSSCTRLASTHKHNVNANVSSSTNSKNEDNEVIRRATVYDEMGIRVVKRTAHQNHASNNNASSQCKSDRKSQYLQSTSIPGTLENTLCETEDQTTSKNLTNSVIRKLIKFTGSRKIQTGINETKCKLNAELNKVFILGRKSHNVKVSCTEKLDEVLLDIPGPMERRAIRRFSLKEKPTTSSLKHDNRPCVTNRRDKSVAVNKSRHKHQSTKKVKLLQPLSEEYNEQCLSSQISHRTVEYTNSQNESMVRETTTVNEPQEQDASQMGDNNDSTDDDKDILDLHAERDTMLDALYF